MKDYIKLLRMKHYIKNFLIFLPMFFAGAFFSYELFMRSTLGFLAFSSLSSAVYILNDYKDIECDRKHPSKKFRPLASGSVSKQAATALLASCLLISAAISVKLGSLEGAVCLFLYFALNVAYSMGLKNKPIVDVVILAAGFVLRVFYGGFITGIVISKWLYLVVTTGSLYMGLGKRRNELKENIDGREVLKYYNEAFLDKNMYVCVALANVFYALWTFEMPDSRICWTIPVFIIILMKYSLDIEGISDGDPVEVILRDKLLLALIAVYGVCIFSLLYF